MWFLSLKAVNGKVPHKYSWVKGGIRQIVAFVEEDTNEESHALFPLGFLLVCERQHVKEW